MREVIRSYCKVNEIFDHLTIENAVYFNIKYLNGYNLVLFSFTMQQNKWPNYMCVCARARVCVCVGGGQIYESICCPNSAKSG